MTFEEINIELEKFIEWPGGSDKLYVTKTSCVLFAKWLVEKKIKEVMSDKVQA